MWERELFNLDGRRPQGGRGFVVTANCHWGPIKYRKSTRRKDFRGTGFISEETENGFSEWVALEVAGLCP